MAYEPGMKLKLGIAFFTIVVLVVPCTASAETIPAGFAPGSLWLSKTELVAGESATLYSVAYNSSAGTVTGDAVWSVDGAPLGTRHFTLAPGTTQILSQSWNATSGSHTFSVAMENLSAGSVVLPASSSEVVKVSVAEPPPPAPEVAAAKAAASSVSSAAPIALSTTGKFLDAVNATRGQAAAAVERALASAVLGTSTEMTASTSDSSWKSLTHGSGVGGYLASAWHALLTCLLFILTNDWLFWIVLVLILYIVLRLLLLMFRERRRS